MSALEEIFNKRIEIKGGGHADAFDAKAQEADDLKRWSKKYPGAFKFVEREAETALQRYLRKHAEGSGKPCGDSHISADKECRIGAGRKLAITKSQIAGRLVDQQGIPIGEDDEFIVYHVTNQANAEKLKANGFKPGEKIRKQPTIIEDQAVAKMLRKKVGDPLDYEPGRGLGSGLSVGGDDERLKHYGDTVIAIKIRKSDLGIPPERKTFRMTPDKALLLDDGYIEKEIPADRISILPSISQHSEGKPCGDSHISAEKFFEFPSQSALDRYLAKHPKAKSERHSPKLQKSEK